MIFDVKLIAETGLQLNPVGARHQREKGITHVEVEQIPAAGISHQQKAALIQPPEFAHGQSWGSLVLGQHSQFPTGLRLKGVEAVLKACALCVAEGLGQIDHGSWVIRE